MPTPAELFQSGNLDEAVQESLALVKKNPADTNLRFQLAELSCVAGDLDRADRQFDTLSTQDPGMAIVVALYRQLIRAELARRECFESGRVPEFIGEPSPMVERHLRALVSLQAGDADDAASHLGQDDETSTLASPLIINGNPTDSIRDLDDILSPVLEVHSSTGKYFWIQWSQIISMTVHPPKRPIDLLWRQASLSIESGPDGEVYLPAIYPTSTKNSPPESETDESSLRLGRATDWIQHNENLVCGLGQKCLLVGEDDLPLMELESVERQE